MHVRESGPDDLRAIVRLFTASVHALGADAYDERQRDAWAPRTPDLARWRERLAALHVLVAEEGDELVGFASYRDDGYVDHLFTAAGCARRGVATTLHDELVARLAERGVTELSTHASDVARPFFERQGYVVVEREVVQLRGVDIPRSAMRRTCRY